MSSLLRVAGIEKESIVNGPGIRYTIFTQGCPHQCPNCHNPDTWDLEKGKLVDIADLLQEIRANPLLQGVTFSGGEPFLQAAPLAKLGRIIKEIGLDLVVYTGYTWEKLMESQDDNVKELLIVTDILVDGPFLADQKDLNLVFRGSANQRIIDVPASLIQKKAVLAEFRR